MPLLRLAFALQEACKPYHFLYWPRTRPLVSAFTNPLSAFIHKYPRYSTMTGSMEAGLSRRAAENLPRSKLSEVRSYCFRKQYDPVTNPIGIIPLAIAENKLMRDEISEHLNKNFDIKPWHLTYGEGPAGSSKLRTAVASFANEVFDPHAAVDASHICTCNGVALSTISASVSGNLVTAS